MPRTRHNNRPAAEVLLARSLGALVRACGPAEPAAHPPLLAVFGHGSRRRCERPPGARVNPAPLELLRDPIAVWVDHVLHCPDRRTDCTRDAPGGFPQG